MFKWVNTDTDLLGMPACNRHERFCLGCLDCWGLIVAGMEPRTTVNVFLKEPGSRYRVRKDIPLRVRDFPASLHKIADGGCRLCGHAVTPIGKRKPATWHPGCVDLWGVMQAQTIALRACAEAIHGCVCLGCGRAVRAVGQRREVWGRRLTQHEPPDIDPKPNFCWLPRCIVAETPGVGPEFRELKALQGKWGWDAQKVLDRPRLFDLNAKFAKAWWEYTTVPVPHADHCVPLWTADRNDPNHWRLWAAPNIQLRCPACHAVKTRKEAADRAASRKRAHR